MIALLLAATPLAISAAGETDILSALHPADADVFLEMGEPGRMFAELPQAPWMRMLRDAEMEKLYGLVSTLGVDLRASMNAILPASMIADGGPLRSMQSMSVSMSQLDQAGAPMAVWMGMRMSSAESANAMLDMFTAQGLLQPSGKPDDEYKLGQRTLKLQHYSLQRPEELPAGAARQLPSDIWMLQDGAQLVMGMGGAAPESLSARLTGQQPVLSRERLFPADLPWSPASGTLLYRLWVDLEGTAFMENPLLAEAREALGTALSWGLPVLFPYLGAQGVWRVEWRGSQFVTETVHKRYPSMSTQALGGAPVDAKVARFVPSEAVGVWLTSIDPARFESELRVLVGAALQGNEEEQPSLSAEQLSKLPSLQAGLGKQAALFLLPISSIQSIEPRLFVAIELADREAFERALDGWTDKLKELAPSARISNRPYRKHKLVSFSAQEEEEESGNAGGSGPLGGLVSPPTFSPTIGVLSDRVLITIKKSFAQTEMRRVLDGKDMVPHAITAAGSVPAGAFEAGMMDWPSYTGKLLDIATGLLPMASSMMGTEAAQLDLQGLPSTATMQRYFQPTRSWSRRLDDGRVLGYTTSSYGPETPLTLLALGVGAMRTARRPPPVALSGGEAPPGAVEVAPKPPEAPQPAEPSESDEVLATRAGLLAIRSGIAVYRADAGRIPDQLALLTKPTTNFPEAFLNGKPLPQDGWKREFIYKPEADGKKYALYSAGPDGKDDNGAGDDVRWK
jgi:hypothetical protein